MAWPLAHAQKCGTSLQSPWPWRRHNKTQLEHKPRWVSVQTPKGALFMLADEENENFVWQTPDTKHNASPRGSTGNTEDDHSSSNDFECTKEELIQLDRDLRLGLGLAVGTACLAQDQQRQSQCMPRHNRLVQPSDVESALDMPLDDLMPHEKPRKVQPRSHVLPGVQAKSQPSSAPPSCVVSSHSSYALAPKQRDAN